jgi:hypothetical protein
MLFYFACEAASASSARHSLRPLNFRWLYVWQNSRGTRGEIAEACAHEVGSGFDGEKSAPGLFETEKCANCSKRVALTICEETMKN